MIWILFTAAIIGLTLGGIAHLAQVLGRTDHNNKTPAYSLLPGDIQYESQDGRFKFYFPVTTSIVLSIVLSLLMRFVS